MYVRSIS